MPRGRKTHHHVAKDRTPDEVLSDEVGKFFFDPLGYVMFCFPWDTEPSIRGVVKLAEGVEDKLTKEELERRDYYRARFPDCEFGPDLWACDFMEEVAAGVKKNNFDGHTPVDPLKFATVSGHEIGKSALVAWLTKWILDTRPNSVITLTAVTDEQLRTKTWAEVGKWHQMSLTAHWYDYSSSRGNMSLVHKQRPKWRADARTARKEKSESFAGQHSPTATSAYIFDEASGIDSNIFDVREGGLTSGEPMVFDFGNGTQNSGAFYEECVGRMRHRYRVHSIDSRTVAITNKKKIADDMEDRGEDSDFFRVRWRGMFPEMGHSQFISTALVDGAMERELPLVKSDVPIVIGVDSAGRGDDDNVIWPRRGMDARSYEPRLIREADSEQMCGHVIEYFQFFERLGQRPAMIFLDTTGGYGADTADRLSKLGYPVTRVQFGSIPTKKDQYRFKSDEMWGGIRTALKEGLALPARTSRHGDRIHADLTQREFGFMVGGDRVHLETKADMKSRGLKSPDLADALAVTFASEVASGTKHKGPGSKVEAEYDPYAELGYG